jgi:hypothetical protein
MNKRSYGIGIEGWPIDLRHTANRAEGQAIYNPILKTDLTTRLGEGGHKK